MRTFKKWPPSSPRPLSQSECTSDNKYAATFWRKGCSANENVGFPVTINTTWNRSNKNAGFPDTTKLHAEEEGCSANENAGFPDTTKTMLLKHDTMLMKHCLFRD